MTDERAGLFIESLLDGGDSGTSLPSLFGELRGQCVLRSKSKRETRAGSRTLSSAAGPRGRTANALRAARRPAAAGGGRRGAGSPASARTTAPAARGAGVVGQGPPGGAVHPPAAGPAGPARTRRATRGASSGCTLPAPGRSGGRGTGGCPWSDTG